MNTVGELLEAVKLGIDGSGSDVVGRVQTALVEAEVVARKDALLAAIKKYEDLQREGRKLKPDVETFDAEGKVTATGYTKARLDELKKHREQLEKVEKAIAKALEGDFSKVKELKG